MNELLGLCLGKFIDGENEIDDVLRNLKNDFEDSESELGEQEDKIMRSDDDDDENRKFIEKIDREEESDFEEMII